MQEQLKRQLQMRHSFAEAELAGPCTFSPIGSSLPGALSSGRATGPPCMLIVIGHLVVDPAHRDTHLANSAAAVRLARAAPGCLHFAVGADVVDPARVDVAERWSTRADLDAFRATDDGSAGDPFAHVLEFHVEEFEVVSPTHP